MKQISTREPFRMRPIEAGILLAGSQLAVPSPVSITGNPQNSVGNGAVLFSKKGVAG